MGNMLYTIQQMEHMYTFIHVYIYIYTHVNISINVNENFEPLSCYINTNIDIDMYIAH